MSVVQYIKLKHDLQNDLIFDLQKMGVLADTAG